MLDYILTITGLNGIIARRDEEGASAVEYGLLVAGIAALIVAVVFLFGGMIEGVFTDTCSTIQAEGDTGTGTCAE
jgi:pilus assembly protein Flp/PilA